MKQTAYRCTELKAALNCLVAYVGALALEGPIREFAKWATEHYESQRRVFTPERAALLLDLKASVLGGDAAQCDLASLIAQLESQGWATSFLKQEIA